MAVEVAEALGAPLDVVLVRKIGCPFHPDLGVRAVGADYVLALDDDALESLGRTRADVEPTAARERAAIRIAASATAATGRRSTWRAAP